MPGWSRRRDVITRWYSLATGCDSRDVSLARPRAIGATAGTGAARGHVGAAARAFDKILRFLRRRGGRRAAPLQLLAHAPPDRVHATHVSEAEPERRDDDREKHELGKGEGKHGSDPHLIENEAQV